MSTIPVPSSQQVNFSNPESIANAEEQHRQVDSFRSADADFDSLKAQANQLVLLRLELTRAKNLDDFERRGSEMYPEFSSKYPTFFKSLKTIPLARLEESIGVMHRMLNDLEKVKRGEMTHTEMRTQLFEKELAEKYVRKK